MSLENYKSYKRFNMILFGALTLEIPHNDFEDRPINLDIYADSSSLDMVNKQNNCFPNFFRKSTGNLHWYWETKTTDQMHSSHTPSHILGVSHPPHQIEMDRSNLIFSDAFIKSALPCFIDKQIKTVMLACVGTWTNTPIFITCFYLLMQREEEKIGLKSNAWILSSNLHY